MQVQITETERKNQELLGEIDNQRVHSRHQSSRSRVPNGYLDYDGDEFYDSTENKHWSTSDGDINAGSRSTLHYEHLLTRLQHLLGPGRHHDNMVDDLVRVCVHHIKGMKDRRAHLQK